MKKDKALDKNKFPKFDTESVMLSTPSCLKVVTADGILVHMNKQGLELIEADSLESVIGANIYDDLIEKSHVEAYKSLSQRVCRGESAHMVFEIIGLKGTRRWLETYAAPHVLPNGELAQIAITNDVTAQKTKSIIEGHISDLRESYLANSGNYQEFFDFLLSTIIKFTGSEYGFIGEIKTSKNKKYLKTYSITDISWNEETRTFYKEKSPEGMVFGNLDTLFGEVIKTGKMILTNEPGTHPKAVGVPPGHPCLNAFLGVPLYITGKFVAMVGIANRSGGYDMNLYENMIPLFDAIGEMIGHFELEKENQQKERELADINKYLELALEGANLGIWDWWLEDNSVKFDRRWAEMLGLDYETIEMNLVTWESRVHPEDLEHCYDDIKSYMNGETDQYKNIHRMKHSNGDWIYILDQGKFSAWDEDGKATRFTGTHLDVTEQKKQEERVIEARNKALIAEKAKMQFLANMSHEIRTPMNGVLGMVDLVLDTDLNASQKEMINTIKLCGNDLMSLLNDILDISKIEAGKLNLEFSTFNLADTIEEVIKLTSNKAIEKGIVLSFKNPNENNFNYSGDVTRVKQILINLISNSIKFTNEGRVDVFVELPTSEIDNIVTIIVKDTGIGISKENQAKLFDEFIQADNSTTRKFGGTGLGLSICQRLVSIMKGEIKLESILGEGTTFSIKLPLEKVSKEVVGESSPVKNVENKLVGDTLGRVLIVEDNIVNQKVAAMSLKKLGYDSDIANNGQEAIDLVKKGARNTYHLILMDMQMPVMDGIEATIILLRDFRELCPPIVAMTANAFPEDRERCFEVGMLGFLSKPIQRGELDRALHFDFLGKSKINKSA